MGPPAPPRAPLGLLLLLGLAAAQKAVVLADLIMTLLIAGGAYCLAGRSHQAPKKPRPPETESTYQELRGARGDVYSDLRGAAGAAR
ncbi:TYRO protein tyrosine kinase-binding protein isoform X2 [Rhea pennata]|uniref:TYRO protein tyrosine kinase-binding protein isoform X2 n=1 Tax=Rhea pennata TaxID=8795 RepID=UPI002E2751E8